jgi:hypothetical protein
LPVVAPVSPATRKTEAEEQKKASALMDRECLMYLAELSNGKIVHANELSKMISEPRSWLKVAMLVRADFVETLDSSVRITDEGLAAWGMVQRLARKRST